jgi:hypothetical protein
MTPQRRFLLELAASLRGARRARRRLLLEVEQHLADAVRAEALADRDLGPAELAAVARLGSPATIAASWNDGQSELRGALRRGYAVLTLLVALAGALGLTQYASGKSRPGPAPACHGAERQPGMTCARPLGRLPH